MKATKENINGRPYYIRQYESWLDFVGKSEDVLELQRTNNLTSLGHSSMEHGDSDSDWAGTSSLDAAVKLAYTGWPEGRERCIAIQKKVHIERLMPTGERIERHIDLAGDEPDIDLYLQDEPEHMVTQIDNLTALGRVVRLVVDRGANCMIQPEQLIKKGLAVFSAVETMIKLGYSINLSITEIVGNRTNNRSRYRAIIPVLHAGDPINLDTLIFLFAHPSVLRRLVFAAEEGETNEIRQEFGFGPNTNVSGYGVCNCGTDIAGLGEHDVVIHQDEFLNITDDQIVKTAIEVLQRCGIETDGAKEKTNA